MRRISAQYILTGAGELLRKGVITAGDDGLITGIHRMDDVLKETASTEFYNGVVVPGFINCHCHLELSHMVSCIEHDTGLGRFIAGVNSKRQAETTEIVSAAHRADRQMYDEGIVACGDISNDTLSFDIKKNSDIEYVTFIEVFGSDETKAGKRISGALAVKHAAAEAGLRHYLVPHAAYSVSQHLFSLIMENAGPDPVISMHFLESPEERQALSLRQGPIIDSYKTLGIDTGNMNPPADHTEIAMQLADKASHLLLVHNTCITRAEAEKIAGKGNVSWCLCPSSNIYITGTMPPAGMLEETAGEIVLGTDSLASNNSLSILKEMKLLQDHFPHLGFETLVRWATYNGARALGLDTTKGSLAPGLTPGILLIENMDLINMKLLPQSRVRRLL